MMIHPVLASAMVADHQHELERNAARSRLIRLARPARRGRHARAAARDGQPAVQPAAWRAAWLNAWREAPPTVPPAAAPAPLTTRPRTGQAARCAECPAEHVSAA
jgi:hypothetical protein